MSVTDFTSHSNVMQSLKGTTDNINIHGRQARRNVGHCSYNPAHTRPFCYYMKTYLTNIYKFLFSIINK